jgi:hypothetical protein
MLGEGDLNRNRTLQNLVEPLVNSTVFSLLYQTL